MDANQILLIFASVHSLALQLQLRLHLTQKRQVGRLLLWHFSNMLQPEILKLALLLFQRLTRILQLVFEEFRGARRLLLAGFPVLIDKKRGQLIGNLRDQPGVFSTIGDLERLQVLAAAKIAHNRGAKSRSASW